MNRMFPAAVLAAVSFLGSMQASAQSGWTLGPLPSLSSCTAAAQAAAAASAVPGGAYVCTGPTAPPATSTITVVPPTTPVPTKPVDETRNVACVAPTVGTWTQTHSWTLLNNAWVADPWAPATAPAAACVTPIPPPATGAEWTGVTTAMWAEQALQRASFGDPNDCKARVAAIPTTGFVLPPGGNIANALASNSVVMLQTGTYPVSSRFAIPAGKKLVGALGHAPVIDASSMSGAIWAIAIGDNAVIANVELKNQPGIGIVTYNLSNNTYSKGGLIYQVAVHDSGMDGRSLDNGTGLYVTGGSTNFCVVSSAVWNTFNTQGGVNANGGNSDGIANNFGSAQNSFIDVHARNTGDDGFDMWQGGQSYWYFSSAASAGKVPGTAGSGNGNGIKVGIGAVAHKFYKTDASDNRACGWVNNGNTQNPILVQSGGSGNGNGTYCYFTP